jgi:hypothetical protein
MRRSFLLDAFFCISRCKRRERAGRKDDGRISMPIRATEPKEDSIVCL